MSVWTCLKTPACCDREQHDQSSENEPKVSRKPAAAKHWVKLTKLHRAEGTCRFDYSLYRFIKKEQWFSFSCLIVFHIWYIAFIRNINYTVTDLHCIHWAGRPREIQTFRTFLLCLNENPHPWNYRIPCLGLVRPIFAPQLFQSIWWWHILLPCTVFNLPVRNRKRAGKVVYVGLTLLFIVRPGPLVAEVSGWVKQTQEEKSMQLFYILYDWRLDLAQTWSNLVNMTTKFWWCLSSVLSSGHIMFRDSLSYSNVICKTITITHFIQITNSMDNTSPGPATVRTKAKLSTIWTPPSFWARFCADSTVFLCVPLPNH